jgi:hypothetical protein
MLLISADQPIGFVSFAAVLIKVVDSYFIER